MFRKILWAIIVALYILALSPVCSAIGETITFDNRGDFFSYAQMVALLNQEEPILQTNSVDEQSSVRGKELIALLQQGIIIHSMAGIHQLAVEQKSRPALR